MRLLQMIADGCSGLQMRVQMASLSCVSGGLSTHHDELPNQEAHALRTHACPQCAGRLSELRKGLPIQHAYPANAHIAPRAAKVIEQRLQSLRHTDLKDTADVWMVDAHSKGLRIRRPPQQPLATRVWNRAGREGARPCGIQCKASKDATLHAFIADHDHVQVTMSVPMPCSCPT